MNKFILIMLFLFSLGIASFLVIDVVSLKEKTEPPIEKLRSTKPTFENEKLRLEYEVKSLKKEIKVKDELIKELKNEKSQVEKVQNILLGFSALIINILSIIGMFKKFKKAE